MPLEGECMSGLGIDRAIMAGQIDVALQAYFSSIASSPSHVLFREVE